MGRSVREIFALMTRRSVADEKLPGSSAHGPHRSGQRCIHIACHEVYRYAPMGAGLQIAGKIPMHPTKTPWMVV